MITEEWGQHVFWKREMSDSADPRKLKPEQVMAGRPLKRRNFRCMGLWQGPEEQPDLRRRPSSAFPAVSSTVFVRLACSPPVCVVSLGPPVSSHIPKLCTWGEWRVYTVPVWVIVGVSGPGMEGCPVQGGSCPAPGAAGRGLGHHDPKLEWSGCKVTILLVFSHLSYRYV